MKHGKHHRGHGGHKHSMVNEKEHDSGVSHEREHASFGPGIAASAGKLWNRYEHQGAKDIHKCRPSGKMS